jgi:hypothetical protein
MGCLQVPGSHATPSTSTRSPSAVLEGKERVQDRQKTLLTEPMLPFRQSCECGGGYEVGIKTLLTITWSSNAISVKNQATEDNGLPKPVDARILTDSV